MGSIPFRNKPAGDANLRDSLAELRNEVTRVVDNLLREPKGWAERALGVPGYPAVELRDTESEIIVRAETPGLEPSELEITVAGDMLTLSGERRGADASQTAGMQLCEFRYGTFRRQLELPCAVDAERVTAESRHGVVTIRLPKLAQGNGKRVPITPQE